MIGQNFALRYHFSQHLGRSQSRRSPTGRQNPRLHVATIAMTGANVLRSTSGRLLTVNNLYNPSPLRQTLQQTACFSTTSPQCKRKKPVDGNKQRGVSALYRSGPRKPMTMSGIPLPRPRSHFKPEVKLDKTHGLWGFFPEPGKLLMAPAETEKHGRAWTVEELRKKSWEDLHALWWSCCRERNFLATSRAELLRAKIGYGEQELKIRDAQVWMSRGIYTGLWCLMLTHHRSRRHCGLSDKR